MNSRIHSYTKTFDYLFYVKNNNEKKLKKNPYKIRRKEIKKK